MAQLRSLLPYISLLSVIYLASGFLALYNWLVESLIGGQGILTSFAPADVGFAIVMLAVGITFIGSLYYMRLGDDVRSSACLIVGSGLAVAALIVHVLVVIAALADAIIMSETLTIYDLALKLVRAEFSLGLIVIPLLLIALKHIKRLVS